MEWNSDEIDVSIDFIHKRTFVYNPSEPAATSTMLSAIYACKETVK